MIKSAGRALGGLAVGLGTSPLRHAAGRKGDFTSRRPPAGERRFTSAAVEAKLAGVRRSVTDQELAWIFENCFPNTLDTTVQFGTLDGQPETFVITGDIEAMWLRDSTAQVWAYLPLAKKDKNLKALIAGVINRQTRCILLDPYANAFNYAATGSKWEQDLTRMRPELHERKWEIDSLCYPVRLAHGYWKETGDTSCFDRAWREAMRLVVKTLHVEQRLDSPGPYTFQRTTSDPINSLPLKGRGNPTRPVGLIHSGFRPSDDACVYLFLVPSNLFAAVSLNQLAEIHAALGDRAFADDCAAFASEVDQAVNRYSRAGTCGTARSMPTRSTGVRQQTVHGRRQRAEPALAPLPRLPTARGRDLPEHAGLRLERGQSVLLPRAGGRARASAARTSGWG